MKLETIAVRGGYTPDPTTKAVAVPIYQTTSYAFDSAQHGADLFDLKVVGNIYSRIMNPTNAVLEQRVADMEGGIAGLALASGMSAITYAVMTIVNAGHNVVTSSALYGGTYNLFAHTFPQYGIEVRFADYREPDSFAKLIDENTRAVFCESVGNPLGNVVDFEPLAELAHQHHVPLIVDNTVPTPYLCRPFEHGADIVVHSLTKYMGGHGNGIGGVIVDSGRFPWEQHKARYKQLVEPDVSYHGVSYTEVFGNAAFIARARVVPLRNMGAALSPFNAFLFLQGLETLPLRAWIDIAPTPCRSLGRGPVSTQTPAGILGAISRPGGRSEPAAGGQISQRPSVWDPDFWHQGRFGGGDPLHRRAAANSSAGKYW